MARRATMTMEHKQALARGRAHSNAVRAYLTALRLDRPRKSGRTPEQVQERLAEIATEIEDASPIDELHLIQERLDLKAELDRLTGDDALRLEEKEAAFIASAAAYSVSKGISYEAWREIGVAASVLRAAGITR